MADDHPVAVDGAEKLLKSSPGKKRVFEILRKKFVDRQMVELNQRLEKGGLSDEETLSLLKEKERLRQVLRTPLSGA